MVEAVAAPAQPERENAFIRALLENSSDVITILDVQGTILFQSPSVTRILGYPQHELVGTSGFDHIHPDDLEPALAAFRSRVTGEEHPSSVTYRFRHADGSWRVLEATGRNRLDDPAVRGFVVNAHDVTERQEAEQSLQNSERRYRSLFENAADVVTILDADGTIRYESPSAERTVGWTQEELVGRNMFEFVHPDDAARIAATFQEVLSNPGAVYRYELRFRHADGSWRVLDGLGRNLLDDPAVRGIVANSRDVTDRKEAEEELLRAKEAAEAANRAKSDFLSSMSHELRTPLNSVIGFTNVLRSNRGGNLGPQDLTFLERILANGTHLLGLINDILDLSKIEAGKMEMELGPVAVDRLVRETVGELRGAARGKKVEVRVVAPEGLASLETDALKLKQILINLVGNAIKFTEEGTVTVAVTADPETCRPVRIDVTDTGVGIPPERLPEIFRAFEQAETGTARRYGGTGLGLAICRSLAQLLGCALEVESTPGAGSTFSILFAAPAPATLGASASDPDAAGAACAPDGGGDGAPATGTTGGGGEKRLRDRLVLVIDDDADSRLLLTHHLQDFGCRTASASTGEEGLRMARELRPDLITLDLLLPGATGWEILQELKADPTLREVPVVIVSVIAGDSRETVVGAVELLEKPVAREALLDVVRRHLEPGAACRALVVDDEDAGREILAGYLTEEGVEIRAVASAPEALALLESFTPDLVVLDLPLPDTDNLGLLRALHGSGVPVVVVAGGAVEGEALEALGTTAGLLRKDRSLEEDLRAVLQRLRAPAAAGG